MTLPKAPKVPTPPDPTKTIEAQTAANMTTGRMQTDSNRYNQISPFGTQTWTRGNPGVFDETGYNKAMEAYTAQGNTASMNPNMASGSGSFMDRQAAAANANNRLPGGAVSGSPSAGGGGAPTREQFMVGANPDEYSLKTEYDPRIMQMLEGSFGNQADVQRFLGDYQKAAGGILSQPMPGQNKFNAEESWNRAAGMMRDPTDDLNTARNLAGATTVGAKDSTENLNRMMRTDFNYDGAPEMPEANEETRQRIANALYGKATSRLDPRFSQEQNDMQTQLAAQGITQGSAAYDREIGNFNRAKTDAYGQATNDSIIGSGNEMQRLFGMGMDARKQGVAEANTMRNQPITEAIAASGLNNNAQANAGNYYGLQGNRAMALPQIAGLEMQTRGMEQQGQMAQRNQALAEAMGISQLGSSNIYGSIPGFGPSAGGAGNVMPTDVAGITNSAADQNMQRYQAKSDNYNNKMQGYAQLAMMML